MGNNPAARASPAIEQHKPWLNAVEVAKGIGEILSRVPETGEFPRNLRAGIEAIFRKASPWDAVKDAGKNAIPPGQASKQYERLQELCQSFGLWIVPVGELEGFCKSAGGKGPGWVQTVLETFDLASAPQLSEARAFMKQLWSR